MTYDWFTLDDGRSIYRPVERMEPKRSDLPAPMVVTDTMEPVQNMVDGKFYTSKSAMRATYKPSGNAEGREYVEIGNDPARFKRWEKPKPDRAAIRETVQKAKARFERGERVKKRASS